MRKAKDVHFRHAGLTYGKRPILWIFLSGLFFFLIYLIAVWGR